MKPLWFSKLYNLDGSLSQIPLQDSLMKKVSPNDFLKVFLLQLTALKRENTHKVRRGTGEFSA